MRFESGGESAEGVTAIAQNSDPFTYFASSPIRVCEGIEIDDGTLSVGVLKRATQRDMPTLIRRLFSEEKPAARHRQVEHFDDVLTGTISSVSEDKDGAAAAVPAPGRRRLHRRTHAGRAARRPRRADDRRLTVRRGRRTSYSRTRLRASMPRVTPRKSTTSGAAETTSS